MAKLKIAFLIGRFQPFHNGHRHLIDYGLNQAERVVVLVGGTNQSRSMKNPWTFDERKEMIMQSYDECAKADQHLHVLHPAKGRLLSDRINVEPLPDVKGNDDAWLGQVYDILGKYTDISEPGSFGIIGFKKDNSSYYLDLFPTAEKLIMDEGFATLSATHLREAYFKDAPVFPRDLVPESVLKYLIDFYQRPEFSYVLGETKWKEAHDKMWAASPFPPAFITCDAVCTQMGKVLLVTRGEMPGKGLLALPGGFVEAKKGDSFENVLYELWEETCIEDDRGRIPRGKLRGFYTGVEKRFDDPGRSVRGISLTTAFRFKFPNAKEFFKVAGGDDAAHADWYSTDYIKNNPELIFEDHHQIMADMDVWQ